MVSTAVKLVREIRRKASIIEYYVDLVGTRQARKIRDMLLEGKLTYREALKKLNQLARKNTGREDKVLDLDEC